ncbi:hypothetical protein D3C78_1080890 [compost metagenome]
MIGNRHSGIVNNVVFAFYRLLVAKRFNFIVHIVFGKLIYKYRQIAFGVIPFDARRICRTERNDLFRCHKPILHRAGSADLIGSVKESQRGVLVTLKTKTSRHFRVQFVLIFHFQLQSIHCIQYF